MPLGQLHLGTIDKTLFSMATPEVKSILEARSIKSIVLFGIEVRTYPYLHHRPDARVHLFIGSYRLMFACFNQHSTFSNWDTMSTSLRMAYQAVTKKRCLLHSQGCARPVLKLPRVRAYFSNCSVSFKDYVSSVFSVHLYSIFRRFLKPDFQGIFLGDQSGKGDYTVCSPKAPDTSQCTLMENEFQSDRTRRS